MSTKTNEFGGITLLGKAHSLSALFVVALRAVIGGMILFAGLGKVSEWPFDAAGYLANVDPASPVSGLYALMASSPALVEIVNVAVPVTQLLVGAALIAGAFVRLAALGGATQMALFDSAGGAATSSRCSTRRWCTRSRSSRSRRSAGAASSGWTRTSSGSGSAARRWSGGSRRSGTSSAA